MESSSFKELSENFTSKLDGIGMLLQLRDAAADETSAQELQSLKMEENRQRKNLNELKKDLAARKESLDHLRHSTEVLKEWKKKLGYIADNMPALPKKVVPSNDVQVQSSPHADKKQGTVKQESGNAPAPAKQQAGNTYCPEIDWLTTDEFEKIPKYLKGRLSYDRVNKFIEGMNKAYSTKYKLLKLKKSSLNDARRKQYEAFKLQETKDTAGCYFVVDADLKEFGGLQVDNVARSILTMLRHCGRCREVRGGKLTRYCYIDSY